MESFTMDDGDSRAFGDNDDVPQEIDPEDVSKTSFVCNYPAPILATLI